MPLSHTLFVELLLKRNKMHAIGMLGLVDYNIENSSDYWKYLNENV